MSRALSIPARRAMNSPATGEAPITLVTITHDDLAEPVRLCSDWTERLAVEPLTYGTVSQGETYLFALMGARLPDDKDGSPPRTTLVFENVGSDHLALIRSMSPFKVATVSLKVVLASSPDLIELEEGALEAGNVEADEGQVSMEISREPLVGDNWPCDRTTKARFPGMHR